MINGTLFDWKTYESVCDVKADGVVLSNDPYVYDGIGWNAGDDHFTVDASANMGRWDNFISCVMLIKDGKRCDLSFVTPDVRRSAGRTAIFGTYDGGTYVYVVKEGTNNMTPEQLQRYLLGVSYGVKWALMLDGGGSSQLTALAARAGLRLFHATRAELRLLLEQENGKQTRRAG